MRRGAWVLVAMMVCASAFAQVPDPGKLREYVTPRLTIITNGDAKARKLYRSLTEFERVIETLLGRQAAPSGAPTYLYVVRGSIAMRYLQPSRGIIGEFVPGRFANYLLINEDAMQLQESIQHEYTHYFLRTQYTGFIPLWFNEGLAELLDKAAVGKTEARIRSPYIPASPSWIPLSRLLALEKNSKEYLGDDTTSSVHAQSWAIVHRALIDDAEFRGDMFEYLRALNEFVPIEDAVQDSFGVSLAQLDADMRRYFGRAGLGGGFNEAVLKIGRAEPQELPAGRLLTRSEAYESIARAMLDTGFNPTRVAEVIGAAAAAAPGAPSVNVLRARLAARDRDDATLLALLDKPAPDFDAASARGLGLAAFERSQTPRAPGEPAGKTRAELASKAFALLDRALAAEPGDPECVWAWATLAAEKRERLEDALRQLDLAQSLVHNNPHLSLARAAVHLAREDAAGELAALTEAARSSSSLDERAALIRRIQELRQRQRANAPQ